jgi:hypothetical protein
VGNDLAPRFGEGGDVVAGRKPNKGPLPYVASLWSSDDSHLILFESD